MYFLAPYRADFTGPAGPTRRCVLADVMVQREGEPEPFVESEGLGGYAVAMILDPALQKEAARVPGVLALGDIPILGGRLGDMSATKRKETIDALHAQGFTKAAVTKAVGKDPSAASLRSVLRLACSTRRKPRYDPERDEIVLDGPAQPTRDLPLPPIAGGAFGDALAVIDDYNRADAATLGANWSSEPLNNGAAMPAIVTNRAMSQGAFSSVAAWYNAATFGPDVEVAHTLPVAGSQYVYLFVRLTDPSASANTADGYALELVNTAMNIYRQDNAVGTALGAEQTVTFPSSGDRLGFEANGSTLQAHRHTGSWATYGASRSDATYAAEGYVGWGSYEDVRTRAHDDFSAGTITASGSGSASNLMLLGIG